MSMRAGSGTQSRSRGSGHMPCTDTAPPRYTCGPEVGDKLKSGAETSTLRLTLRSTERQYTNHNRSVPDRVPGTVLGVLARYFVDLQIPTHSISIHHRRLRRSRNKRDAKLGQETDASRRAVRSGSGGRGACGGPPPIASTRMTIALYES